MLTPNFDLDEFTRSATASSLGIANDPTDDQVACLRALCSAVLEPWRARIGAGLEVTSGFRSKALNEALRTRGYSASPTSQHLRGEAADVRPLDDGSGFGRAWVALVALVEAGLPVDQAIVYPRGPGRGWIHVSHTARTLPRHELLVWPDSGPPVPWARWRGPVVLPA